MSIAKEKKYEKNGRVGAAIVSVIILILFTVNLFSKQNPAPGPYAIALAFGAEDLGANDDANPAAEENIAEEVQEEVVEEVEPEPIPEPEPTPDPVAKEVVTDDTDAPSIKKEKPKKPKPKKPTPKKEEVKKPVKPKKPIGGSTFSKDKKGKGKGDKKKPGPSGDKDGDADSGKGKPGVTAGGDVGGGLSGRGVLKPGRPVNKTQHFGSVVIKVCVNPDGNVVEAVFTQRGSTTSNSDLTKLAKEAAKKYKFKKNPYAPDKQCGTITYRFLPS